MDFLAHHILSVVLFTPLLGALVLLFIPREMEHAHKIAGNVFGALGFLVSLPLLRWFKPGWGGFTFEETADWIPSIGAKYHLGIDGISLPSRHAHHVSRDDRYSLVVERDSSTHQGILHSAPPSADGDDRRFRFPWISSSFMCSGK